MTPKENMLEVLNWGNPEYVPISSIGNTIVGIPVVNLLEQPMFVSGKDAFGVNWLVDANGSMHDTSRLTFEDISEWRNHVVFPDLDQIDFKEIADKELASINREQTLLSFYATTGVYERLAAFMGFENLLCELLEDPDECRAFFDAMADWKIKLFRKVNEAYHLDVYVYFDDIATVRGLFMSPQTYREVIKPAQAKIAKAVIDAGVRFSMHCCGKCEDALEDFVEIGATIWNSAQSVNDLQKVQREFKGRLVIEGGWDTEGSCSMVGASADALRTEMRRMMDDYGRNGGFIAFPILLNEKGNSAFVGDDRMDELMDEYEKTKYCL